MLTAASRGPEFTPPPEPGLLRSVSLAVGAHVLLALALSWGIDWKRHDDNAVVEAELWSATVREAAPKPVEAPPPPPPPPAPVVQQPPAPPQRSDADIALERQRERQAKEKAQEQEKARRAEAERQRKQELDKRELARKAAEDKKREEQAKAREKQKQQEALAEKQRQENIARSVGLAGATGSPSSSGTAQRSSGPSATYAGRLAALFQRNVVFAGADTVAGNPEAEIQVRVSPTGDILSARLARSSGNPAWDEAAVRAIERTEKIPPDVDGRYVQDFPVKMRPKR